MENCDAKISEFTSKQLVSLISSPALIINTDAKILFVNDSMHALLEADEGQLSGCLVSEVVAPGDWQRVRSFVSSFSSDNQAVVSTEVLSITIRPASKPGTLTPLIDKSNKLTGLLLQADGAELVKENRLCQSAVSTGRLGVWERDFRLEWSTRLASWWQVRGFEPDELPKLTHDEWLNRVHPDDRHYFHKIPPASETDYGRYKEFRYRERNRQGDWIWILSRVCILTLDDEGQPLIVMGVDADITETVIAEQHRAELAERLSHVEKLKSIGQLTGGIAHDFNNLLAVISGNAELLLNDFEGGDPRLNDILTAVNRGSELTGGLLAFARKQPLQPCAIDVEDLLSKLRLMLRRTIQKQIAFNFTSTADIWSCMADKGQLQNALINLALNARDAMDLGGTLSIATQNVVLNAEDLRLHPDVQTGEYVMFTIADDGTGMTKQTLERAFEPFYTTKLIGMGTGLGLSMVFGFVKQSNGHMSIESTQAVGTTVRLYLPRTEKVSSDCKSVLQSEPADHATMRIMLVEDDEALRSICTCFLQENGYQVRSFESTDAAIESFIRDDGIDLLLSDLVLPGELDGIQLGVKMRRKKPELKILFMSGYNDRQEFRGKLHNLSDGYLQKPFLLRELTVAINEISEAYVEQ